MPTAEEQHRRGTIVIDTPEGIEAYRIIATYRGLQMEINMRENGFPPTACPTRGLALRSARSLAATYKLQGPTRTRKQALATLAPLYRKTQPKEAA